MQSVTYLPQIFHRIFFVFTAALKIVQNHTGNIGKICLQTACVLNIAYENLDILAGKPVSLDFEDLYDKIVTRGRGGYCFDDIAVGQIAARLPIKLEEGLVQTQNGETYRFERDTPHSWLLWELYKGEWRKFISFSDEEQYDIDYVQPHYFCLTHPDSIFNKKYMLAIKTPEGRCALDGPNYKVFHGEELVHLEENLCEERLQTLLREVFKLQIK